MFDSEFRPLVEDLIDNDDVRVVVANPGDHVPHAERNNRSIKDRTRMIIHGTDFTYVPITIQMAAGKRATFNLTAFPAKGGVSQDYSPYTIMTGKLIHYDDFKYKTGAYVTAYEHTNPHNDMQARQLDCIYLLPCYKQRYKGHELLHIATGKVITRARFTVCQMTDGVIKAVHALAKKEGMHKSLKMQTRAEMSLSPDTWNAGVEDQPNNESDTDSDDETYDSESDYSRSDSEDDESVQSNEETDDIDTNDHGYDDEGLGTVNHPSAGATNQLRRSKRIQELQHNQSTLRLHNQSWTTRAFKNLKKNIAADQPGSCKGSEPINVLPTRSQRHKQ